MIERNLRYVTLRKYGTAFLEGFGMLPLTYFGAVGDNKTDNYANIQVAIDETIKRKLKFIFVPEGTYYYTGELLNVDKVIFIGNASYAKIYNEETEIKIYQIGTYTDINEIETIISQRLEYQKGEETINKDVSVDGYFDIETNVENANDAFVVIGNGQVLQVVGNIVTRNGSLFAGVPMHSIPSSNALSIGENVHVSNLEIIENGLRVYYTVEGDGTGTISTKAYWRVR